MINSLGRHSPARILSPCRTAFLSLTRVIILDLFASTWCISIYLAIFPYVYLLVWHAASYRCVIQNCPKWGNGSFMAVQWRTETSTGNLTACYERYMRSAVEEQRLYLGFKRNQVYVNTDLVGRASTTYNSSVRFHFFLLIFRCTALSFRPEFFHTNSVCAM